MLAVAKESVSPPARVTKGLRDRVLKHLAEEDSELLQEVWQELSSTLVERYARLEFLAANQFGETLAPSSEQLEEALYQGWPSMSKTVSP